MAYLDVITLQDAKLHLRISDTAFDSEIERLINAALSVVERYTNVYVYARDKQYYNWDKCFRIYDYPINSVESPAMEDYTLKQKSTYSLIESNTEAITLNIGYTDPVDVPSELKEAALQILDVYFYGSEEKKADTSLIPSSVYMALDLHKRFTI